jgi:hypothetical protein
MVDHIEILWEDILSRQFERIQTAFSLLSAEEKIAVLNHLKRMISEPGWHPQQVMSASKALETINDE